MPVPVSVLPVRARMVLSLRISSQDASEAGASDVGLSAARRERPDGIDSETKRAPPIFTKPRRVIVAESGELEEGCVRGIMALVLIRLSCFTISWPGRRVAQRR